MELFSEYVGEAECYIAQADIIRHAKDIRVSRGLTVDQLDAEALAAETREQFTERKRAQNERKRAEWDAEAVKLGFIDYSDAFCEAGRGNRSALDLISKCDPVAAERIHDVIINQQIAAGELVVSDICSTLTKW